VRLGGPPLVVSAPDLARCWAAALQLFGLRQDRSPKGSIEAIETGKPDSASLRKRGATVAVRVMPLRSIA
jgi:hypothetical protein